MRLYAWIPAEPRTKVAHRVVPASPSAAASFALPPAALLAIDDGPQGTLLVRYSADEKFAGDTWHSNLDEAKSQAEFEFGR